MERRIETPPFITHLMRNTDVVSDVVSEVIVSGMQIESTSETIHLAKFSTGAPQWFRDLEERPLKELHRLSEMEFWVELILQSDFDPAEMNYPLLLNGIGNNVWGAAFSIAQKARNEFGSMLPMFGVAAISGKKAGEFITGMGDQSAVRHAVEEAAIEMDTESQSAEEFLERLRILFPENVVGNSSSAFSRILATDGFRNIHGTCPAVGLVKKITEAYGREIQGEAGLRLIVPVVAN